MKNRATDISQESVLNRVLRENALVALMLFFTIVSLVHGLVLGLTVAVMMNNSAQTEALKRQFEINAAWQGRLVGVVQSAGIDVPPQPTEERGDEE